MKKLSVKTITFTGLLTALHIIFARFISIPVGQLLRISISGVPVILCGLWLGPVAGGLCGLIGDLIGCAINGYAPNPFITAAATLVGVLPALFKGFLQGAAPGAGRFLRFLLVILLTRLLTSVLITTIGLSTMYHMAFWPTLLTRLPSTTAVTVVDALLCELLYSRVHFEYFMQEG